MFSLRSIRMATVGVLLTPYALVLAQTPQELMPPDLVKGNYGKYATSLKPADLPDGYSAVRLTTTSSASDPISTLFFAFSQSRAGGTGDTTKKYRLVQSYWTNGDTVFSFNRSYLVTYKIDSEYLMESAPMMGVAFTGAAKFAKPDEPTLRITLVAMDSLQSITPCPDLTKADLISTFGGSGSGSGSATQNNGSEESKRTATLSNAKQVALGMIMYSGDYDDEIPYVQSTKAVQYVIYPYVKNKNVFNTLNPRGGSILFNMGIAGYSFSSIPSPAETVMFFESEPWSDGKRVVAFCDGHCKVVDADTWANLSKHLKLTGLKRTSKPLPLNYGYDFNMDKQSGHG